MTELRFLSKRAPWYSGEDDDRLLWDVAGRAATFCRTRATGIAPEWIAAQLFFSYDLPNPHMVAQVAVIDGRLAGYAVVAFEDVAGTRVATVLVMQGLEPIPRAVMEQGWRNVQRFSRAMGATRLRAAALSRTLARVYRMYYGRWSELVLMEQQLEEVNDGRSTRSGDPAQGPDTAADGVGHDATDNAAGGESRADHAAGNRTVVRFPGLRGLRGSCDDDAAG